MLKRRSRQLLASSIQSGNVSAGDSDDDGRLVVVNDSLKSHLEQLLVADIQQQLVASPCQHTPDLMRPSLKSKALISEGRSRTHYI